MNDDELSRLIRGHATRHTAGDGLRAAVRTQMTLRAAAQQQQQADPPRRRGFVIALEWRSALAGFLGGAVVAGALALMLPRLLVQGGLPDELVADHVRALKVGPLYTVASSDRHTVKPWFQGRLDYAPTVADLSRQGFTLLGGRVEQVAGSPTAALSYERGHHIIHAFVWPAAQPQTTPAAQQIKGFNLLHWSDGAMQVWLVSDIEAGELERFRLAWTARPLKRTRTKLSERHVGQRHAAHRRKRLHRHRMILALRQAGHGHHANHRAAGQRDRKRAAVVGIVPASAGPSRLPANCPRAHGCGRRRRNCGPSNSTVLRLRRAQSALAAAVPGIAWK